MEDNAIYPVIYNTDLGAIERLIAEKLRTLEDQYNVNVTCIYIRRKAAFDRNSVIDGVVVTTEIRR